MTMSPRMSKFALTTHVISSVGWFGSVACFLALAIAGVTTKDAQLVRYTSFSMELIAWYVIVPMNFASLLTGLIQSLGTKWGLFRHYWVLIKLSITLISTFLLLVHMQPIGHLASLAAESNFSSVDVRGLQIQLAIKAGLAMLALFVVTVISVYKPKGMTRYGWRKQREQLKGSSRS